jgi:hypothetical protein
MAEALARVGPALRRMNRCTSTMICDNSSDTSIKLLWPNFR